MAEKKEVAIETVMMQDGRVVDFAGKRRMLKETFVNEAEKKVAVRFDFRNGETRLFTVPADQVLRFAGHGAEQKIGDETAGIDDLDDMILAVDSLIDRLYNGEWGVRRASDGMAGTSILLKALVEHTGKSVNDIREFLLKKSQAEKIALRNNPKIKPIVERLETEKVAKSKGAVDTDALLAELEDEGEGEVENTEELAE